MRGQGGAYWDAICEKNARLVDELCGPSVVLLPTVEGTCTPLTRPAPAAWETDEARRPSEMLVRTRIVLPTMSWTRVAHRLSAACHYWERALWSLRGSRLWIGYC
eukprot:scaffold884_cov398-Prasinococcus_capsulatus_cf.AAC.9